LSAGTQGTSTAGQPVRLCRACKLEHTHLKCDHFRSSTVRRAGIVKAHQHGRQVKLGHVTQYHCGQDTKAMSLDKGKPPNSKIGGLVAHQTLHNLCDIIDERNLLEQGKREVRGVCPHVPRLAQARR